MIGRWVQDHPDPKTYTRIYVQHTATSWYQSCGGGPTVNKTVCDLRTAEIASWFLLPGIGSALSKPAISASIRAAEEAALRRSVAAANAAAAKAAAAKAVPKIKVGSEGGKSAGKPFSKRVREQALDENPSTCVYCRMETDSPQVDHVIPRSRGGNATLENAQTTCSWCNPSKGARDFPVNPPGGFEGMWPPSWWLR